jgi:hypothetical protein
VDVAPAAIPCPVIWDINVVDSEIPDAPPDPDFDKYFASSGFDRVQHLKKVDEFESDAADMYFDTINNVIDPHVMSLFDPHIPDSAPYDDMGVYSITRS